ncbi:alginate O-acetyltransferase AlgX-related protein [Deinococcus sp.]|uniref:alginate O-acetyltransferase AlgX-related protein n=1 Tax=Deinococcus sp. TaxID=47478 RepID=UPI003CC6846D
MTEFAPDTVKPNVDDVAAPQFLQWLPAAFLLGVVGIGAVLAVTSKGARTFPADQNVITGKWMGAYEKTFDAGVPWLDPSVNLWGGANYRLFDEARDGAVVGTDGWLYTSEEFQTAASDAAEIQRKLAYITQVRNTLAKSGAKLVVALIPAKVRIYPDHLGALKVPTVNVGVYQSFRQQVVAAGIPAPDLEMPFRTAQTTIQVFQKTDTHWTPQGAEVAAQVIAHQVKALKLDLPVAQFRTSLSQSRVRKGDLLRYIPVPDGIGPAPDQIATSTTERTDAGGGGLLGADSIPVTLVGTSYSARTKNNVWNFDGQLEQALGSEVINASEEGSGPIIPMRKYLVGKNISDNPPKVVIWEIPERYLRVKYPE